MAWGIVNFVAAVAARRHHRRRRHRRGGNWYYSITVDGAGGAPIEAVVQ